MTTVTRSESASFSETLAGKRGSCHDYKATADFGSSRQPFTWLSEVGPQDENERLAAELNTSRLDRAPLMFEAWEMDDGRWLPIYSGSVNVLYVEVDARIDRVRALLQWTPNARTA